MGSEARAAWCLVLIEAFRLLWDFAEAMVHQGLSEAAAGELEFWLGAIEAVGLVALTGALAFFTYKLFGATAQLAQSTSALEAITRTRYEESRPRLQFEDLVPWFERIIGMSDRVRLNISGAVRNIGGSSTQLELATLTNPATKVAFVPILQDRTQTNPPPVEPGQVRDFLAVLWVPLDKLDAVVKQKLVFTLTPVKGEGASQELWIDQAPELPEE